MIDRYSRPAMKRVWSEENKCQKWLEVELAVCEAWTEEGVIPLEDMVLLRSAKYNHQRMTEILVTVRHETNAFLTSITEQIGPEGRWLHLGLTSSDKLDTAMGLQFVEAGDLLLQDMDEAIEALRGQAVRHKDTIMMGRTHGVHAEPITFGLKVALWWEELRRQRARLVEALATVRVGKISGAVGTHATVPPSVEDRVCQRLGLDVATVSNQVVQRDRHAHFILTLALIAASLEKFATEIRSLQRTEIHELEEPFDEGQKGSSSMPHKRNPELSERICGLARLVRGHSVTALENVALWGERDISHSSAERIIIPDACLAVDYILSIFTRVIKDLRVYPERMWANIESSLGLIFSQRVLLALVDKGMAREDAYQIVQRNAALGWDNHEDFRQLLKSDAEATAYLSVEELEELFDYSYYTRYVDDTFQRLGLLPAKVAV
ncbi:MAG: adenylosuccinate lyase [Chloroflexi bacterium]|nr:adenylosuccinate lyase [Chloroflexota bacterium]MCH8349782.1 adenylosuccinate lyase [Chloroflexota bacterium]MCI0779750.1 adenylosuccinate lyase [Chloroflexota bacterium]MCI0785080.1 adenylosuccinate lyase [Chloroflexota bacterium]MCI0877801.1 adenylosuccinate lyase [Chloroflexota bacterium]